MNRNKNTTPDTVANRLDVTLEVSFFDSHGCFMGSESLVFDSEHLIKLCEDRELNIEIAKRQNVVKCKVEEDPEYYWLVVMKFRTVQSKTQNKLKKALLKDFTIQQWFDRGNGGDGSEMKYLRIAGR